MREMERTGKSKTAERKDKEGMDRRARGDGCGDGVGGGFL